MDFIAAHPLLTIFAALLILIFIIFKTPLKLIFKLLLNTVTGFIVLFAVNYLGSFIGISVPVNWINAIIVGILGVPGVGVVLVLNYLSII